MSTYDSIPDGAELRPEKYELSIPQQDLTEFKDLLRLSKLSPKTYENLQPDGQFGGKFGVTHEWMSTAKDYWATKYDWRATEKYVNSFPNFTVQIKDDDGEEYRVHFVALFSKKPDAIPILFLHGWPGSFLEFLGILSILKERYSPEDLPYHVVVPSLPGYTLSSGPPLNKDFTMADAASILNRLMVGLGLGNGYLAQGGDIGSFLCRPLGAFYDECKAIHINMCPIPPPQLSDTQLSPAEIKGLDRFADFSKRGSAYALEHGTRPATIGFVLSSSPLALLAWIGEKFIAWTDETPSLDSILDSVTLYWFTQSFARCIYPYREFFPGPNPIHGRTEYHSTKPMAHSFFPFEIAPMPKSWVATTGNLVYHKEHDKGGHFAALEVPELLLGDVEEFAEIVWSRKGGRAAL